MKRHTTEQKKNPEILIAMRVASIDTNNIDRNKAKTKKKEEEEKNSDSDMNGVVGREKNL